jgi:hypothetical protein
MIRSIAVIAAALAVVGSVRADDAEETRKAMAESMNNLKKIVLACHNYESAHGHLPNNVVDAKGQLRLSWRVLLLPYLEQEELFKSFKLDESWDGPTNKPLVEKMPKVFAIPTLKTAKGETHYRGFTGPQAMFEKGKKITLTMIADGTSNTLLFVEAEKSCVWTKPDDLPFDPNKDDVPKVGSGLAKGKFLAAVADGSVRTISTTIPKDVMKALITRDGAEVIRLP